MEEHIVITFAGDGLRIKKSGEASYILQKHYNVPCPGESIPIEGWRTLSVCSTLNESMADATRHRDWNTSDLEACLSKAWKAAARINRR